MKESIVWRASNAASSFDSHIRSLSLSLEAHIILGHFVVWLCVRFLRIYSKPALSTHWWWRIKHIRSFFSCLLSNPIEWMWWTGWARRFYLLSTPYIEWVVIWWCGESGHFFLTIVSIVLLLPQRRFPWCFTLVACYF